MPGEQHPVEIILARSLMSNLTTPAFLVGLDGTLVYFNDAAADLLGLRFEEAGPLPAADWGTRFVPRDDDGNPLDVPDLPLSIALTTGQPAHGRMRLQTPAGANRHIEVHALPIVGTGGMRGALAIFWDISSAT
jgi:PAS domain-containing protein